MAKMTPRERVLASINHQNPDTLPMDLGSNVSTGISGQAYGKLKEYLGITTGHNRIYDVVQQVAQPEIQVLDIIGADCLDVGRVFNTADEDWYDVTLSGGIPAQWPSWFRPRHNPDGSYDYFDSDDAVYTSKYEWKCVDSIYFMNFFQYSSNNTVLKRILRDLSVLYLI